MNQNQQNGNWHAREFQFVVRRGQGARQVFLSDPKAGLRHRGVGFPAFCAMVLMLLIGGLGRIPEMFPYLGIWLVMLICQRARTFQLVRRKVIWHSRYEGYPWLAFCFPFIRTESRAKRLMEPLLCLLAGAALYQFSHGLGVFVMAGFVSLTMVDAINRELVRKRLAAMRDAEIEQRWLVARYRGQVDE